MTSSAVVFVTFDRMSASCCSEAEGQDSPSDVRQQVFEALDLQAYYFEQHYAQDIRTGGTSFAALGTVTEIERFSQYLAERGKSLRHVFVQHGSPCLEYTRLQSRPPGSLEFCRHADDRPSGSPDSSGPVWHETLRECLEQGTPADLTWIHVISDDGHRTVPVQSVPSDQAAADDASAHSGGKRAAQQHKRVLEIVFAWRRQWLAQKYKQQHSLWLLVTSMFGGTRIPTAPFESEFPEDAVHTPLWITANAGEFGRVSRLTGSRDLLPTLAELLTGEPLPSESETTGSDIGPDGTAEDFSRVWSQGMSLKFLCEHPGHDCVRTLSIRSDDRDALHTGSFLVVRQSTGNAWEETAFDHPLAVYVKPEDVWNVHNQVLVYQAAVADLLNERRKHSLAVRPQTGE